MNYGKIAIIGAGAVGSTAAYAIIMKNIVTELLLVDVNERRCHGEILDLSDALSFSVTSNVRAATIQEAGSADIIIIAAGIAQKPGQSRVELLHANRAVINSIMSSMGKLNPNAVIVVISNPVDLMTFLIQDISGLPRNQVIGSGTFLDSQRLRNLLAKKANVAEQSVHAYILGEHGDSQFFAQSISHIAGIPIAQFPGITAQDLDEFPRTARDRAYEIIQCKGATYYGIATCVAALCETIIFDHKRVLPVSHYQEEFGVCLSMPAVIGAKGVERIIPTPLDFKERALLQESAEQLRVLCK
ncbi:MAG TPA: L-lactate dehydrogenase [Candidatus Babeliales bacterium]|nr:L-lactate dehydrogenase [Candidatus Babeliales bacterium]